AARGNFLNIYGFCSPIEPRFLNCRVLESLVYAGAMDCFDSPRARLCAAIEGAMNHGQKMDHQRSVGQHFLFRSGASSMSTDDAQNILPESDDWSEDEQLAGEHS